MKGAELEDRKCLNRISQSFYCGYGMEKDVSKGFEYFTKAANLGHAGGQREMGCCLQEGTGTEDDL